jgi:diaminopimelate epimerase
MKSKVKLPSRRAVAEICDRKRGIGADQLLMIAKSPDKKKYDLRLHIWNQDGEKAKMCCNDLRCVAHDVSVANIAKKKSVRWLTDSGLRESEVLKLKKEESLVSVQMGKFKLLSEKPLSLQVKGISKKLVGLHISMGNPHFVLFGIPRSQRQVIGASLQKHKVFPDGVNVIFPDKPSQNGKLIDLEVYERGVGFTEACGSGACAGAVAAVLEGFSPSKSLIQMNLPGGKLKVLVNRDTKEVEQRGPSVLVFKGSGNDF